MRKPRTEAGQRITAWAECVQRLIAVAPIDAILNETGIAGGHATPPERRVAREKARTVVAGWLARDLAIIDGPETEAEPRFTTYAEKSEWDV